MINLMYIKKNIKVKNGMVMIKMKFKDTYWASDKVDEYRLTKSELIKLFQLDKDEEIDDLAWDGTVLQVWVKGKHENSN